MRLSDAQDEPEAVANFAEALDSKRRVRDSLIRSIAREQPEVAARLLTVAPIVETIAKSEGGPANPLGDYLLALAEQEPSLR
jgi:hypothetical protein